MTSGGCRCVLSQLSADPTFALLFFIRILVHSGLHGNVRLKQKHLAELWVADCRTLAIQQC